MRTRPAKPSGVSPVSAILGQTLDNLGILSKAKKYQVFSVWSKVLGDVARHAKPRRLSGDVLYVATASSAWSQELTFMKQAILDKLRAAIGGDYVREIRFSEHMWDPTQDGNSGGKVLFPLLAKSEALLPVDGISDQRLAISAKKFSSTMARRKQYLIRQGYRVCEQCGCLYPSRKAECPYCRIKSEFLAKQRAIAILDKAPYLGDDEVLALTGSDDKAFVARARRDLEAKWLSIARNAVAREVKRLADQDELRQAVVKLAELRSGKPAESLSQDEMEKAVGRRLFLAARKGTPWRHGSTWGPKT